MSGFFIGFALGKDFKNVTSIKQGDKKENVTLMQEEDNIYIYKDDEDPDDSPMNYASSHLEEDTGENENQKEKRKISAFRLLLLIMFNPVEGWKRMRRESITPENLQSGCFYPVLALLALSKFSDYYYSVNVTLSNIVTSAVIAFVSFFFGYFCILFLLSKLLVANTRKNFEENFGKNYIIVGLTTLAIFSIITDLLPMLWPVLIFLPLWTLYLLYKGSRFFQMAKNQELRFLVITCASVIGIPLLIDWGLTELLPY